MRIRMNTGRAVSRRAGLPAVVLIAGMLAVAYALAAVPATAAGEGYRLLAFDEGALRWGGGGPGRPATVTWALQREARHDDEAINCRTTEGLDRLLANAHLDEAAFRGAAREALAMWEAAAGIDFVEAVTGMAADIVIGAQTDPRGIAWTNVEYALTAEPLIEAKGLAPETKPAPVPKPDSGASESARFLPLTRVAICLNPAAVWNLARDGDPRTYALRPVLAHEIGHAIGLDHPGRDGDLMGFAYQEGLPGLSAGDRAGAQLLYGPPTVETAAGTR